MRFPCCHLEHLPLCHSSDSLQEFIVLYRRRNGRCAFRGHAKRTIAAFCIKVTTELA